MRGRGTGFQPVRDVTGPTVNADRQDACPTLISRHHDATFFAELRRCRHWRLSEARAGPMSRRCRSLWWATTNTGRTYPGGRHANVSTNRAMVVKADSTDRRSNDFTGSRPSDSSQKTVVRTLTAWAGHFLSMDRGTICRRNSGLLQTTSGRWFTTTPCSAATGPAQRHADGR